MLKKNEPDWIKHDLSPVCPVPAGHDVAVRYDWGERFRCDNPELRDWRRITHYCDWTAFEQQQASAEVPKLLTEAGLRKILKEEGGVAGRQQDRIVRGFKARALLAPEPEPVDPLVAALASIDIGLSDHELQKLKDMGVTVTAPAAKGEG